MYLSYHQVDISSTHQVTQPDYRSKEEEEEENARVEREDREDNLGISNDTDQKIDISDTIIIDERLR